MGELIKGVWRPTRADHPLYRKPNNWAQEVPDNWWHALTYIRTYGISTKFETYQADWEPEPGPPEAVLPKEDHMSIAARVYAFAMWASQEGSAFKWQNPKTEQVQWFPFSGGISIVDVRRRWEDYGTTYAPRVSELHKAGMFKVVDEVEDPITGNTTEILSPTQRLVPLPKAPSFKRYARKALLRCRKLVDELDPDDEWTQQMREVLYQPALEYLLDSKIGGVPLSQL